MSAMACSDVTRPRRRRPGVGPGRGGRVLAAFGIVGALVALPLAGGGAAARASVFRTASQPNVPVALAVTSVSPSYASPDRTITVKGVVRNVSGAAVSGLSIRMWWSRTPFTSRINVEDFALGTYAPGGLAPVSAPLTINDLATGATARWTIRIPASAIQVSCFGVYPLTAQVSSASQSLASFPIPMPYWPKAHGTCPIARPRATRIGWVWPLIDAPHQGPCPGLIGNGLATAVAPGGRLATLLAVGREFTSSAQLTWAIDPALLDNLGTMTRPYRVGATASCSAAERLAADPQAAQWLSALAKATAGQQVFVTPYADVDVAALLRRGMNADLKRAFAIGRSIASQVLSQAIVSDAPSAAGQGVSAVAWPPAGVASNAVLENLAALKFSTVILAMPPSPVSYTPSAVSSLPDGVGTTLHVLLADSPISELLASRDASSRQPGAMLKISQLYLAETAMIADEAPSISRPIVVTPPRRWNPAPALAAKLLANTVSAPWLRPANISRIASSPAEHVFSNLTQNPPRASLPRSLLRQVTVLDRRVGLLESIRATPDPALYQAVTSIESSAWSGSSVRTARAMLKRTSRFVDDQFAGLSISGVTQVTLGGQVSNGVPVTIRSTLSYPVRVKLSVTVSNNSVRVVQPKAITLSPHQIKTLKLTVHASRDGSARVKLRLTSVAGTVLRDSPYYVQIRATDFGRIALVICAAALAVFVIASAVKAIRHGRPQSRPGADQASGGPANGSPSGDLATSAVTTAPNGSARAHGSAGTAAPDEEPDAAEPPGPASTVGLSAGPREDGP